MSVTSGNVEWNRTGNHHFVAIVRADTAIHIQVVKAGIRCLSGSTTKFQTASVHVDYADVSRADNIDAYLLGGRPPPRTVHV